MWFNTVNAANNDRGEVNKAQEGFAGWTGELTHGEGSKKEERRTQRRSPKPRQGAQQNSTGQRPFTGRDQALLLLHEPFGPGWRFLAKQFLTHASLRIVIADSVWLRSALFSLRSKKKEIEASTVLATSDNFTVTTAAMPAP